MRLMKISMICLGSVFSFGAMASPQPAFECKGASAATAQLAPDTGGVGDFIYVIDDERYAVSAYPAGDDDYLNLEAASGEGALYTGKHIRFFKASDASGLQSNAQIISSDESFECKSTKVASNIDGAGEKGWVGGMALETIVRDGPIVNAKRLDKLPLKEPIAILRNEGQLYQGYPWFQIEYSEGLRGYAWGGTLCSEDQMIEGVAAVCGDVQ